MHGKGQQPRAGQDKPFSATTPGEDDAVIQLIVFKLGDERFGADITQVREVMRRSAVTPIPDSPDFIEGVTNVRGEIAVVIDLKRRFSLPSEEEVPERHIVMTQQNQSLFGLGVDEVTEVLRMPRSDIKAAPETVTGIDRLYISGVITREDHLIIMLDLAKVLSEAELEKLSEIRVKQQPATGGADQTTGEEEAQEAENESPVKAESGEASPRQ